ncbi:MAG: hypothetical protein COW76_18815 [Shewanella sp. CG18_big_fil_WC_8_21_14_2_50_42_11]|nr:MAG: hypothetical protein COW76_18815 [Shewanella sp. CG18_big_fil_WC_8_21_14_2_50_42_11]
MHRMNKLAIVPFFLMGSIAVIFPEQLGVVLYKIVLICLALWISYWSDRLIFPYARPDKCNHPEWAELRRAILMASIILAVATGL